MTIFLFGVEKHHDEPSPSGYCQKLESYLRATGTIYEYKFSLPFNGPKGKVPWAVIDDSTVPDSHFIIKHLIETQKAPDLDALAGLTSAQRATSRAWQGWLEDAIYPATVLTRWAIPTNYQAVSTEVFGGLPWLFRPLMSWYMRRRVISAMNSQGVGRHSMAEVEELLAEYFSALEAHLDNARDLVRAQTENNSDVNVAYFHGKPKPTLIDCIIYGFLANALQTRSNPFVSKQILDRPILREYTLHLTRVWFPEYEKLIDLVTAE